MVSSLPPDDPILLRPIDELAIAARTRDLLKGAGIYYVGDLVQRTEAELVGKENIPRKTIIEIRLALRSRGLDLAQ